GSNTTVIVALQQLLGTQGQGAELLTAGAFLSMPLPLLVFFSLQNFLVRGMTAGSATGCSAPRLRRRSRIRRRSRLRRRSPTVGRLCGVRGPVRQIRTRAAFPPHPVPARA